ncbi:MAG: helix-turn-helix domain-containing protein [Xanthobacteraceae bacterium]
MNASEPLKGFEVMHTHDVEAARHAVLDKFGASGFELTDRAGGFQARSNFASLGDVALCFCEYTAGVRLKFPEAGFVRQQICLSGSGRTTAGPVRADIDAENWSSVIPSGVPVDFDYSADFRQVIIWIDEGRLDRAFSALWGKPRSGALLTWQTGTSAPATLAMRRAIEFVIRELELAGRGSSPLALAEMQDMIVTRFLYSQHVDLVEHAARDAVLPSRPQMRHLEDYLRDHWNEPLTIERLAAIANVGARSIFRYFKQAHGSTPLDFMKTLRLQEAQKGLQNPIGTTSVSSEALRCGFNNMGHFARDYRRKFGELPSETLQKARGRISVAARARS